MASTDWQQFDREVLAAIDVRREFESMGVHINGHKPNASGWVPCRAVGRDDHTPSAAVNIGSGVYRGRYIDHGPGGESMTFWNFCVKSGRYQVWKDARDDFAKKLGISRRGSKKRHGKIVAEYNYPAENGTVLYQAVRMDPKDFRQRRPDGNGGWIWNISGVRRVLYRLPELMAADLSITVYIPEGEKDVDRLVGLGLVATCNVSGAGKWRTEYSEFLRGRNIVILLDNDTKGRDHGRDVAKSLQGIATSIKIVELPGLPEKGDVSDWLDAGHTVQELLAIVDETPVSADVGELEATDSAKSDAESIVAGHELSDTGNADRFIEQHGRDARFSYAWARWLVWDGSRFKEDDNGRIELLGKQTIQTISTEADKQFTPDEAERTAKWALKSQDASRLGAMLKLARPDCAVKPSELNKNGWLLNVANGTLDLRTGILRPHSRDDLLTKASPVAYEPEADCPQFKSFLDQIMAGNLDLISFLQRAAGYSLTGKIYEHVMLVLYGTGANGKSTLLTAMMNILGPDYATKAPKDLLLIKHGDSHPTDVATLFGKRLVFSNEADDGRRLAEGLVKDLTGGDEISARRMRENFWTFEPTHKLWLCTNHKPIIKGNDNGIWRRIRLVPFTVSLPLAEQDEHLPEKLRTEYPGILRWMVEGCRDWQKNGLGEPREVREATAQYRDEMDVIGAFLGERCIVSPTYQAKASGIYAEYCDWCKVNGEYVFSQRKFGRVLTDRGFERYTNNGVWYRGLTTTGYTE